VRRSQGPAPGRRAAQLSLLDYLSRGTLGPPKFEPKRDARGFPLSDVTGGALSASEAMLAYMGLSFRCVAWFWQDGAVACRACVDRGRSDVGDGYREPLFESPSLRGTLISAACACCRAPVCGIRGP
jgi:hypothetical protein